MKRQHPRIRHLGIVSLGVLLIASNASHAAPPILDPDWPCQQVKVSEISLTAFWSGPDVDPEQADWKSDPSVVDLVQRLAPRREPIDHAEQLIREFAQGTDEQRKLRLLKLLVGLFNTLDEQRTSVIVGLDRFGRRQKELAEQVRTDNEKLQSLQADPSAPTDAVTQATQHVTWEVEVFQDRRRAIGYACGVPAKIEQRLFALAHMIQDALP